MTPFRSFVLRCIALSTGEAFVLGASAQEPADRFAGVGARSDGGQHQRCRWPVS
jgi:hypothetical protein